MSRLRIVHTSAFRYTEPVQASYNEARVTPLSQPGQSVLETRVDVQPQTWSHGYRDYWGTHVTAFEVLAPHRSLLLTAEHVVEVAGRSAPSADVGWDLLRGPEVRDRLAEFLADGPTTAAPDDVVALARAAADGLAPAAAAEAVCRAVREELDYIPGVTSVHTPAAEAWEARTGVCQDMAHLVLGALRSVGVPARYVSGYLNPDATGEVGSTVTGESHAWVEWWTGEWYGFDPTNRVPAGEQHVVLGRGRSYDDVPPLRGIYAGPQTEDLYVEVRITREA
ncbi:transglutaminase family protein [Cellulomonas shaoxiangyii]|uniref:Transglutaminase family protein n=1 Tax=Cellulomonas shaoxiangyii TaxID=2566013 RepID=A0A4P7SGC6_9CELL|nr:transglutaminase family protein [Cellulomonas shaoxiangyii]QCB93239.1 transglutaminase family protein [Cellulomonas shaoxiangyii]TGY78097.1 transglutaminase family protein [Cellulomonas shaoxiangyii]